MAPESSPTPQYSTVTVAPAGTSSPEPATTSETTRLDIATAPSRTATVGAVDRSAVVATSPSTTASAGTGAPVVGGSRLAQLLTLHAPCGGAEDEEADDSPPVLEPPQADRVRAATATATAGSIFVIPSA